MLGKRKSQAERKSAARLRRVDPSGGLRRDQSAPPICARDLKAAYYITHIDHLPSILEKGLLSHNRAAHYKKVDISDREVQERRAAKTLSVEDYEVLRFVLMRGEAREEGLVRRTGVLGYIEKREASWFLHYWKAGSDSLESRKIKRDWMNALVSMKEYLRGRTTYLQVSNRQQKRAALAMIRDFGIELPEVRRDLTLHRFVNLYLQPHNAMMHRIVRSTGEERMPVKERVEKARKLCVLVIHRQVLRRRNVYLTDRNAATDAVRFYKPADYSLGAISLKSLQSRRPFLDPKTSPSEASKTEFKQRRQAELLVPREVASEFISGVIVYDQVAKRKVAKVLREKSFEGLQIDVNVSLFRVNPFDSLSKRLIVSHPEDRSDLDMTSPVPSDDEREGLKGSTGSFLTATSAVQPLIKSSVRRQSESKADDGGTSSTRCIEESDKRDPPRPSQPHGR